MCSLFGLIDYTNCLPAFARKTILRILSQECEVRGTDATGIAYMSKHGLQIFKRPVPASKLKFTLPHESRMVIGHTRMTTKGNQEINANNHPFFGRVNTSGFSLAHNGVLHNDEILRKAMHLPETSIETDSYIAVQLLEHYGDVNFRTIKEMAETVNGSFCFSILTDKNEIYLVKGSNPLVIYDCGGFYVYASTADILNKALKRLHLRKKKSIDIHSGDILRITADGKIDKDTFSFESYEYPYLSYWDRYTGYYDDIDVLDEVIRYARYFGFEEKDVRMLSDLGYGADEIEEMLYEPEYMKSTISEYRDMFTCECGG